MEYLNKRKAASVASRGWYKMVGREDGATGKKLGLYSKCSRMLLDGFPSGTHTVS